MEVYRCNLAMAGYVWETKNLSQKPNGNPASVSLADAMFQSSISTLPLINRGKVRDIYAVDDEHLLIVTTDRLSAFDVVLPDPVPGKGEVLTAVSRFWFQRTADIIANHLSDIPVDAVVSREELTGLGGRGVVVRRLEPLPVEAIARGYIIGSGWKDYQKTGSVCGIALPPGLQQAQQLPAPVFTPSSKAAVGGHDENIDFDRVIQLLGRDMAQAIRRFTLQIYEESANYARDRGIIIADTKFEFGIDAAGNPVLIDEVLTPDSSRFWPTESYQVGTSPPSFDKQYVRDYLETLDWDKTDPGPHLPPDVLQNTADKYREAEERLTKS